MRNVRNCFSAALICIGCSAFLQLFCGSAFTQDKISEKSIAQIKKLQGYWAVTELMEAGKKAPDAKARSLHIVIEGVTITIASREKKVRGIFMVDAEKSPATMDIRIEKGGKEIKVPAIFELKGDELKICHPYAEGGERPTVIESSANTILMTLKKKKH